MKKRIFFTALLALTLCLFFAFSIGAEEIELVDDLGDPSWYTGKYTLMTDKTSRVVLANGDGTYTAYPAYYVLKYSITVKDGAITEAYVNGFDYSFVNEKTGKSYSAGAIYKVELPYGLTTVKNTYFGHNPKEPNVVEIVMADSITSIGSHAFRETENLKKVVLSKNLTKISTYGFYKAKGLEEVIFTPGSEAELDVSESNIFCGCSALKEMDLSTRKIITLGASFLSECTNLGKVTLPDCLENIGYCSLYKNPNMYLASDFLPSSLKSIGFQFLSGCTNSNSVLFFPEGFEDFTATYCFATERYKTPDTTLVFLGKMSGTINLEQFHASSGQKIALVFTKNSFSDLNGTIVTGVKDGDTTAFVAKTVDTTDTDYYSQTGTLTISMGSASESNSKFKTDEEGNTLYYVNSNSYTFYFCGGENVEVCYGIRSSVPNSTWGKHFTTPFEFDRQAHIDAGKHFDVTKVEALPSCGDDGVTTNKCALCSRVSEDIIPATGNHTLYGVSPCADKCEICEKYVQKATKSHSCIEKLSYENGYLEVGTKLTYCENEGCEHKVTEGLQALFTVLGYSVYETGDGSVLQGFLINAEALNIYMSKGISFDFGVVASTVETPLDENGLVTDSKKVIKKSVVSAYRDAFEIKVIGIKAFPTTPFVACGYVVDNGKVYYLDNGLTVEAPTLKSYNQLIGIED